MPHPDQRTTRAMLTGMARPKRAAASTPRKPRRRKNEAEPGSRGLGAAELGAEPPPADVAALAARVEADGGSVLGRYREPLGGAWTLLCGLPVERVEPTPFQRDLSEPHVARLAEGIAKQGRFLDPVVAVRTGDGRYWTPNGNHRLSAMRRLGARAIVALVIPDPQVAYRILAMNTEKAHTVREKALEVIRMARALADLDDRAEASFAFELEEPALLTLGLSYEARPRFSGGAYHPILKRVDGFLPERISKALAIRDRRARALLALDDVVGQAVDALKARGLESPYLRVFVLSRINYLKFVKGDPPPFDEALAKLLERARRFDATRVDRAALASASGPPEAEA